VRQIQVSGSTACKFLGVGSSSYSLGMSLQDDMSQARIDMRNKVASVGGNAYVKTSSVATEFTTTLEYDMYRCLTR